MELVVRHLSTGRTERYSGGLFINYRSADFTEEFETARRYMGFSKEQLTLLLFESDLGDNTGNTCNPKLQMLNFFVEAVGAPARMSNVLGEPKAVGVLDSRSPECPLAGVNPQPLGFQYQSRALDWCQRIGLGSNWVFTRNVDPGVPCRLPSDHREFIRGLLAGLLRLWLRTSGGRLARVLAVRGHINSLWSFVCPMIPPGQLVRRTRHLTRGPDASRTTQYLVARGEPLALT